MYKNSGEREMNSKVVSLKWLEEYCEDNNRIYKVEGNIENHTVVYCILIDGLLFAAKKQAELEK